MSQAAVASPQNGPSIPPAFKRTPINPHSDKVKAGLAQDQILPPVNTTAVPVASPVVVAATPPVVASPLPITDRPPVTIVSTTPVAPPQNIPQYDPCVLSALQQAEAEKQRLAQELATQQETVKNLLNAQQELDTLKQRQALQDSLSQEAFADLGTVDPEDAKKITDVILKATAPAMVAIQQDNAKLREQLAVSQQQITARMEQQRIQQLNAKLLQAHPDIVQLQNDPAYVSFMNQRDGLSSQTRDQRAAQEFTAGNVDYVIDLLNQLKGVQPSAAHIASVAPVQTASAATAPVNEPQAPAMDLRTLNSMYQMRQITHDEYRAKLKELRAAPQM